MTEEKPSCEDFIVKAIRLTRRNPKNIKRFTNSGKALDLICALATQFYSEQEFRQSLQALLTLGELILVARIYRRMGNYGSWSREKILQIPPKAPLDKEMWRLDANGEPTGFDKEEIFTKFVSLRLFIVADGLPQSIERHIPGKIATEAKRVMESLQK